jgi:hypothetical protein
MSYRIIQPPFTLRFREMPKKVLKEYFVWFLEQIPERVAELEREVKTDSGFVTWRADNSSASLRALGHWFAGHVETRLRTTEEIAEIDAASPYPIPTPNQELTNRTFSLAIDIGMYFGQTLRAQHPKLEWQQPLGSKKFVDYGQPVLAGFGTLTLNPVRIAITMAYAIAGRTDDGKWLSDAYDVWSNRAVS